MNRNLAQEEANRRLVVDFYERVFNGHDLAYGATVMADHYRQHNPTIESGKAAFLSFFTELYQKHPGAKARIARVATGGDMVWVHAHHITAPGEPEMAVVDMFRVESGKLVEHWDVMQTIPPTSANANSMF